MTTEVLRVENLATHFFTKAGTVKAVDGVSFRLEAGEVMGLVGESGSGKSVLGYSLMGLIDAPGKRVSGRIFLAGHDISDFDQTQWRAIRGNRIALIFQDPMVTLNPVLRIDTQMIEAVRAHEHVSHAQARERCREALARVGIASPEARLEGYPHQFSGGMRQRVAIAIALLNRPDLIICDEPTTALDVSIQGQILHEMQKLGRETGTALIWITHDLSIVAGLADRVSVIYAGRIVESGSTHQVLEHAVHPYTRGLIASTPSAAQPGAARRMLHQIPGMPPVPLHLPAGCPFHVRCERSTSECHSEPPLVEWADGRTFRCFHPYLEITPDLP